jgi:insecticidal toxin complex protein TccC
VVEQRDARLFASAAAGPNLATVHSLSGNTLKSDSADAGWHVALNNEDGSTAERRDSRATYTRYEYDVLRRVMAVFEASVGPGERCVERFIYGDDQADSSYNMRQQMLRHDDPAGTRHMHAYDLNGLPQQERQHFLGSLESPDWPDDNDARDALLESGDGMLSRWTYSPWGEQLGMTDAAGNHHQQRFDIAGRLMLSTLKPAEQETSATLVEQVRYNAFDQMQSQVAGNGLITETAYDPADGRLSRLLCTPANDAQALQDLSYFYDPVGNVVRHEDHSIESRYHGNRRIDPVSTFSYDSLYQLIEATGRERLGAGRGPELPGVIGFSGNDESLIGTYSRRYQYDAGGSLLVMQHQGQNGQAHTLRMAVSSLSNKSIPWREGLSDEQIENTFDANGNLSQLQPGQTLHWDLRNQLAQVTLIERENNQNDAERYIYGGGGKRLRKYANRQASGVMHHTETRYLPGLELHEDSATGQRRQVVNINAGRGKIRWMHWLSTPPAGLPENSLYYGFDNQLGSVTLETDEHGQVASREEYYPFGGTALIASRNEVEVSFKTLRYSGKERDATGLYDYGYRYLAPWLCRWLNPDPAGAVDGLNLFGFVGNNPVTWVDGDGRMWQDPGELSSLIDAAVDILEGPSQESPNEDSPSRPESAMSVATVDTALFNSPPGSPLSPANSLYFPSLSSTPPPQTAEPQLEGVVAYYPPDRGHVSFIGWEVSPSSTVLNEGFRIPAPPQAVPGPSTRAISTDNRRFVCETCNKSLSDVRNLNAHKLQHTGEKPHSCDVCTKSYADRRSLKIHKRSHTSTKPYSCDLCTKSFITRNLLTVHSRVHTGEQPYICDFCAKPFADPSSLARHKRIHSGEKPHTCNECHKAFRTSDQLRRHQPIHTGEKLYNCPFCDSAFPYQASLYTHKRNLHPGSRV